MDGSRQNQELFLLAFDLSPTGMIVVDAAGKLLLVNREIERLFGYTRQELIGNPVELLVPAPSRSAHAALRVRYFSTGPEARPMGAGRDLHGRRKDGTQIPLEIGLSPVQSIGGMLVLGTVVDLTARRATENQLRQSQKMEAIGTLAGGIAHDFNNLLHGIVGHAELVLRQAGLDPEIESDVNQILKIAERGRQLVNRILTFSRQQDVSRTPTRLDRPIREAIELLRVSLPREIEIHETLDPDTPLVRCDETQIHQIVVNLATNSAHAMAQGGALELSLTPFEVSEAFAATHRGLVAGSYARLSVVDSGHGMSAETLERALEPFFTTKPRGKGTGLGLSMIHGVVRSLGGAIEISSRPGAGTRVDIYVPAAQPADESAARVPPAGSETWPHVLVVEDEVDFANMLRRQLEAFEYRATVHTSSVEALQDFTSRPHAFDVLMTDNSMPRMSGLQLAQEVRKIRSDLPILLVSGTAAEIDSAKIEALGISRSLRKPHSGKEMDQALRNVLGRGH